MLLNIAPKLVLALAVVVHASLASAAAPASGGAAPVCPIADSTAPAAVEAIRTGIVGRLAEAGNQPLAPEALTALSTLIDGQLATVRKDRLSASCQRQLNLVLADVADGSTLMRRAGHVKAQRMGLWQVVNALNLYGAMFKPAGWLDLSYRPAD